MFFLFGTQQLNFHLEIGIVENNIKIFLKFQSCHTLKGILKL